MGKWYHVALQGATWPSHIDQEWHYCAGGEAVTSFLFCTTCLKFATKCLSSVELTREKRALLCWAHTADGSVNPFHQGVRWLGVPSMSCLVFWKLCLNEGWMVTDANHSILSPTHMILSTSVSQRRYQKCWYSLLPSPVWQLLIYLDSWTQHSRFLCNTGLYTFRLYFYHQPHPQLGVVFPLALSLHSFWS